MLYLTCIEKFPWNQDGFQEKDSIYTYLPFIISLDGYIHEK